MVSRVLSISKMAKEDRESFVMYGSFLAAAEKALNYEGVGKFILLLRDYAIKGEDAHSEDPVIEALLMMAKPNVSAAQGRYDKAKKGGESGNKGADHG